MNTIKPIFGIISPAGLQGKPAENKNQGADFMSRLKTAMNDVNSIQLNADTASEQVVQGKLGIHEGMMAVQEADVSLRYMLQLRSKTLDAYREIMRMQF